jgi:hypothetical protein
MNKDRILDSIAMLIIIVSGSVIFTTLLLLVPWLVAAIALGVVIMWAVVHLMDVY